MLPTYQRMGAGGTSTTQILRRALRTREKFLILLLFSTLVFVCLGGLLYLPDNNFLSASDKVRVAYKNIGPEIFIPAPPVAAPRSHRHGVDETDANNGDDGSHILNDRERLNAKIQHDWVAGGGGDHLEKPQAKSSNGGANEAPIMKAPEAEAVRAERSNDDGTGVGVAPEIQRGLPDGEDKDPVARERRNKVKEVSSNVAIYYRIFVSFLDGLWFMVFAELHSLLEYCRPLYNF